MQSDKIKNTEEKAEKTEVCEVTSEYKKQRFGLKIFPETLEIVDTLLSTIIVNHARNLLKRLCVFIAGIF